MRPIGMPRARAGARAPATVAPVFGATLWLALAFCRDADAGGPEHEEIDRCLAASEVGQLARKDTKYKKARESFRECARSTCPGAVSRDCTQWLHELDQAQPTVVLQARDADGRDTSEVTVFVDGELLATQLDGRALDVDPGEHVFRFETRDRTRLEQREIVRDSEKGRRLEADFAALPGPRRRAPPPPATAATESPRPTGSPKVPLGSWVLGVIGIGGVTAGSILLITGRIHETDKANSACAQRGTCEGVDAIRREYWAGGLALGIGAVALGAAVLAAATRR